MANGDLGLLSFSAIQDAPELLRANQDMSRSKGHLAPMAEPSPGQCCLAAVDLCQSHCKGVCVSRCSAFPGLGNGRQIHQITRHTLGTRLFDPDPPSSPPCPVTPGHPEPHAGVPAAVGAVLISSSRLYSPQGTMPAR